MDDRPAIAAILTSYNRAGTTLGCLARLFSQEGLGDAFSLDMYLFDDGSPDGTGAHVAEKFPQVILESGDGHQYWNGGMRAAYGQAMAHGYDFYLWVNDDTHLFGNAIMLLLNTYCGIDDTNAVIVGTVRDPDAEKTSYGGLLSPRRNKLRDMRHPPVTGAPARCDTFNGNCVLIPHAVARNVGNLDPIFTHKMADMDYGYRCGAAGAGVWATGDYVGTCPRHGELDAWRRPGTSLRERFRALTGPKGLPPGEWRVFCRWYAGPCWPLYWITPYVKALVPPR